MRYVIRERFFHLGEDSDITDEQGQPVYRVDGKVWSLHNTLTVRDLAGTAVARVERQLVALRPTYHIMREGQESAAVRQKLVSCCGRKPHLPEHCAPDTWARAAQVAALHAHPPPHRPAPSGIP